MSTSTEERRSRELQHLWHRGLELVQAGEQGTARAVFEEGIRLATSPDYDSPHRLFQLRRDLAELEVELGNHDRAIELLRKTDQPHQVARSLLFAGRVEEALSAARSAVDAGQPVAVDIVHRCLFLLDRHAALLVELTAHAEETHRRSPGFGLGRRDGLVALIALRSIWGRGALETDRGRVQAEHRRLYNAIVATFANWKSALAQLDRVDDEAGLLKLKGQLSRRRRSKKPVRLEVDLEQFEAAVEQARTTTDAWASLQEGARLAVAGKYDAALAMISPIEQADPSLWHLYGRSYAIGALILANRLPEALEGVVGGRFCHGYRDWQLYLNLLHRVGGQLEGAVVADRFRGAVLRSTSFLDEQGDAFATFCQDGLDALEAEHGVHLLQWAVDREPTADRGGWSFFIGSSHGFQALQGSKFGRRHLPFLDFAWDGPLHGALAEMVADAESVIRKSMGLPAIGAGWISEARVVRGLRVGLAPLDVVSQGSPKWLGAQRFDAWVPELKLAVEYQGRQHYESVEFFGGADGLLKTQQRDRLKAELCRLNGVRLETVRYDADLDRRVAEIVAMAIS